MAIVSKKTWDVDKEKKKMAVNIGGGGIGAVFLLGGALATAAFVSAFVVGKKGRSSGGDRDSRCQNPPPEINKQNEQDEGNRGRKQTAVVLDQPSDVGGAKTEVGSDNDTVVLVCTEKSTMDQKLRVEEINGGKAGDFYDVEEAGEEIESSTSPTKSEMDAISDGSVVTDEDYPLLDEKLRSETLNMMPETEVEFCLTKEDVSNVMSKETANLEQVCSEEERAERETNDDDGEMEGTRHEDVIEIVEMQPMQEENIQEEMIETNVEDVNGVEGVHIDETEARSNANVKDFGSDDEKIDIESTMVGSAAIGLKLSENDSSLSEINVSEDGLKALVIIEHENVELDEVKGALPVEIVGIIQERDEVKQGNEEEQFKYIEEQLVKEEEKCEVIGWASEANQGYLLNDTVEVKDDRIPCESKEENGRFEVSVLKQELIFDEDVGVVKDDGANKEEDEDLETNENKASMQLVDGQLKDDEKVAEENMVEEVNEELISHDDVEVVKEEIASEKVAESSEINENKTLIKFVADQPKLAEHDFERNIGEEVEYSLTGKNDPLMEMSGDEENGEDKIEDSDDDDKKTVLSDEAEKISEGSGDSSMESNSEAVYPVDSPQETTVEPREMRLLNQEVAGKIQEDKAINKDDSQFILAEDSESFELLKMKSLNKAFIDVAKNIRTYSTRQRMLIGTLCVLSPLSCSWFFGLSSVELCLVVLFTMVLSTIVTSRKHRITEKI